MTIINEPYIPACPAAVEISMPPSRTLQTPPRPVDWKLVAIYGFHPLVLVVGFIPVILLGWLGFIFLQYPDTFGQFVYLSYIILPFVVQLGCAAVRLARVYWYLKYGLHGVAKIKEDPLGMEVIDAVTQTKVLDLGVRSIQYVPSDTEELIVLYSPSNPEKHLSLIAYKNTFFIRFDLLRVRFSAQVILSIFTLILLFLEFIVVVTVPYWSGIKMLP